MKGSRLATEMNPNLPPLPAAEAQAFVINLGKVMHHYAAIERLVNALIEHLVGDAMFTAVFVRQGISKRLELLDSLVARHQQELTKLGCETVDLFAQAKMAFQYRNKVAHNPYMVTQIKGQDGAHFVGGIHVVRHHDSGRKEDLIDLAQLERLVRESSVLLQRFAAILNQCQAARERRSDGVPNPIGELAAFGSHP